uniref:DUF4806 domain-containing protein n=1 Tax=Stomoxys calcitrans TaxID=35570 RepID=A0A1I8NN50_STOCA
MKSGVICLLQKRLLQRVGGKDVTCFIKMAIKTVISDELAVNLTWRGTSEKPSIQQFSIINLIADLSHLNYKTASVFDINRVCQQHFLHAKNRVNRKLKTVNH